MESDDSYSGKHAVSRISRRELLASAVGVGVGAVGMTLVGCSDDGGKGVTATSTAPTASTTASAYKPQTTAATRPSQPIDKSQPPKNAIVILLDSLNRHMVGAYGGTEFATPSLDRFAQRAVRFDSNFAGSLPCIPARHDLLCGALDFLWKPWGSMEI